MRSTFAKTLAELGLEHPEIILGTADLGYMALEPFAEAIPDRFFNFGVAEQNMIGVCTGLAQAGFIPFAYSIATFASLRAYEFIRNGPILHRLPVRIIGVGAGFDYGSAGPTHHALEDIAVLRTQPGITIVAPADAPQARAALLATWNLPGPVYYRLSKDDKLLVPGLDGRFELGRLQVVRDGTDALVVVTGAMAMQAVAAADDLASTGVEVTVAIVSSFNPSPSEDLARLAERFDTVLSIEAHYVDGGLGSFVAETLAEHGIGARLVRCGVKASARGHSGGTQFYHHLHGLSKDALSSALRVALAQRESV